MTIIAANLEIALAIAINVQAKRDLADGLPGPSGIVEGWSAVLMAIKRGEPIEVRDDVRLEQREEIKGVK